MEIIENNQNPLLGPYLLLSFSVAYKRDPNMENMVNNKEY